LNSSVYRARVAFIIVSPSLIVSYGIRLAGARSVGVPLGEKVRGELFLIAVIAEGTDGYKVLYSLAEVDPAIHTGDVVVADMVDGQKLGKDGAFRWCRARSGGPRGGCGI
jgi:Ni,Fe-hydrogenase maturation factor